MTEEFKKALSARIGTPLLGTFTLSLLVFNWEILSHLLSGENPRDKISAVQEIMSGPGFPCTWVYAFASTGFICFIMPLLTNIYEVWFAKRASKRDIELNKFSKITETMRKTSDEKISSVLKLPESLLKSVNLAESQVMTLKTLKLELYADDDKSSISIKVSDAKSLIKSAQQINEKVSNAMAVVTNFREEMKP